MPENIKVSIFASAVRPHLWDMFLISLRDTTVEYEVVFAGNADEEHVKAVMERYHLFRYIHTGNIKPAQAYEVARRNCTGELVQWTADDAEYRDDCIGKAYRFFQSLNNRKAILSMQTVENYGTVVMTDMSLHSFFGNNPSTPRMAPIAMMNREYLNKLGGLDRRYICGQWENDIVMRANADQGFKLSETIDGCVVQFKEAVVEIDHINKHGTNMQQHLNRPFAKGYIQDRQILEETWSSGGRMKDTRSGEFKPFTEDDILIKSQDRRFIWD
jgi:hypothetical protein